MVDISTDADYFAYQMKHDSVHGRFKHAVSAKKSDPKKEDNDVLVVGGDEVKCVMAAKDPSQLPWKELGADYVIESTGLFTDSEKAKGHLAAGARKVMISAPGKGDVKTLRHGGERRRVRPGQAPHRVQRLLHHQLPGAAGARAAQGGHRHREPAS